MIKLIFVIACAVVLSSLLVEGNFVQSFERAYLKNKQASVNGKIWVLLVAGSNGYFNYRHQADVCHAYQVVHNHGIPDEQVVVMMYDDIADAEENPTKGIIINHPDGNDVYHGVPKDYTREDVTPANFLNILKGEASAMKGIGSGKVIASGSNDHVFVYFADHGAPGLIAFPTSELMKDDLNDAINSMHQNNKFAQMVVYVEACESGSMFDNLLSADINVYATTAANPDESSYACYYDNLRETYLGDRYSVSWLEDSDKENIDKETLNHQFEVTKEDTKSSHVMQYGDITLSKEVVSLFQGDKKSQVPPKHLRKIYDDVPSPDVPLYILRKRLDAAKTAAKRNEISTLLSKEEETRRRIDWTTKTIARHAAAGQESLISLAVTKMPKLVEFGCYKSAVAAFDDACYELDNYEYAYRRLYVLGNLCDSGVPLNRITDAIRLVCK